MYASPCTQVTDSVRFHAFHVCPWLQVNLLPLELGNHGFSDPGAVSLQSNLHPNSCPGRILTQPVSFRHPAVELDWDCSAQGMSALVRNRTLLRSPWKMYLSRTRHSCTNHWHPDHGHCTLYWSAHLPAESLACPVLGCIIQPPKVTCQPSELQEAHKMPHHSPCPSPGPPKWRQWVAGSQARLDE